ncbi:restriction endonuclease [Gilvimarinus sp. SDUM040013]|uniref:Restriction endonuclease n=1 Tax=Gilvimarinus gilvus TaxID=3058038 RepID=A0ABU4S1U7_9GAMM|nr:restriction endonuclease [Gilvimarinus sp. SDUM040013]MDO3386022.1 restriction endonuclease [Gilvimarinus sp. SDUM040013]MDX6850476.1 restriction endonuclease [Gilvimarinus sp. SDUM040013]
MKNVELDRFLENTISQLRSDIKTWAKDRDLWHDTSFSDHLSHTDREPGYEPVITLLLTDGPLCDILAGEDSLMLQPEFDDFLHSKGFWYDCANPNTYEIYVLDEALNSKFANYFHWRWVCSLIQEDTADVYEEIYSHFKKTPNDLNRLDWRRFEILLFRIFQNHGFRAVLGPGRNDGGIDLQLFQTDPLGDIMTIVQAKRYAMKNKIDQTQVAALYGISVVEEAEKALFVTSSEFSPVAKRFAARTSGVLELADRNSIVEWCNRAEKGVIQNKSLLVEPDHISKLIGEVAGVRDGRVVHGHTGYSTIMNSFALVVKETNHAALLMRLPAKIVSHDGYRQVGLEVPDLTGKSPLELLTKNSVWRAKRSSDDGKVRYWDGRVLYSQWDGQPQNFDHLD